MNWATYLIRRLVLIGASLLVLSAVIFAIMEVIPGDLAQIILGRGASPEQVEALRQQLQLDRPAIARYGQWVGDLLSGNFGESISLHSGIGPLLLRRARNSLILATAAALVGLPFAISLGFVAGLQRPRWLDPLLSRAAVAVGALPEFLIAILLIMVFSEDLHWLPATSLAATDAPLRNPIALVLPALTLVLVMVAYNLRITRASVAKVRDAEFVVAAEFKQLPLLRIVWRHIAPNALLPTVTVAAAYLGWMVGGLVVIEAVFAFPGLGLLILVAAKNRDVPLLEAAVVTVAAFRMFVNLGADIVYRLIDPRVRIA